MSASNSAVFSSFLFTHNIQVTFLVFALGITLGVGTAAVLVSNGVPLGALAVQYHLAGHERCAWGLADTHAARVAPEVWALFDAALARIGPRPALVEWDAAVPALDVLLDEARIARSALGASLAGESPAAS